MTQANSTPLSAAELARIGERARKSAENDAIILVEIIEDIVDAGVSPLKQTIEWIRNGQPKYWSKKQATPFDLAKDRDQIEHLERAIKDLEEMKAGVTARFPDIVPFTEPKE